MQKFKVDDTVIYHNTDGGGHSRLVGSMGQVLSTHSSAIEVKWLTGPWKGRTEVHGFQYLKLHSTVATYSTNPKAAIGSVSLPVQLFPASAIAFGSIGMHNGRCKYGQDNFVATEVAASVYVGAALRHILDWHNGEDNDPADGVHNLAGALANLAIIVDAMCAGTLVDDRRMNTGAYRKARELMEPMVKKLNELHKDRDPKHYTIKDKKEVK